MTNKKYNPFADTYNFNANSNNWVQKLGYNADFYNNPLGYNSSPTPRPYDNTTVFGADDDNEVVSGFKPQTPRTTSLNNGFNVNKQQPSMGNMSSFNLKGNNTSEFNTGSNNWVQRLGHNADFYNNPLGYNSSPIPRPYDNTTKLNNNVPKYWDSANEGRKVLDYVIQKEGNITPESQDFFAYGKSGLTGGLNTIQNYMSLRDKRYTDKYKHALINCKAAQSGKGGYNIVKFISDLKEKSDVKNGRNTIDSSLSDNYANEIGRLLGTKYRKGDCDALIQQYINKNW